MYTPRTIAFLCDLLHPPTSMEPGPIQRIHNKMFEEGTPAYQSFQVTHEGSVLSNPVSGPAANSSVSFLSDRIRFREELGALTYEQFAARVAGVCASACEMKGIQLFTAQQVTIRSLINPRHFSDSRKFLESGVFGFDSQIESFDRQPQLYGLRLVFAPEAQRPNAHALRIESFHGDPRSLFVEDQGSFGPVVVAGGLDAITANVKATYDFLVDRALEFISRFDARQEV